MPPNQTSTSPSRLHASILGAEPFRLFFPTAILAGVTGVALWPLYFGELIQFYPGPAHARLMVYGFFGGFILGFLGTAMPRMLSAPVLGWRNVLVLLFLYLAMVAALAAGNAAWGDGIFAGLLLVFGGLMVPRFRQRQDLPPPGFILVVMALLCALASAGGSLWLERVPEANPPWAALPRLLGYQGFVLLPILGIGPFILPRFFGMPSAHDFPELARPSKAWLRKAALALGVGGLIILSFFIEAGGRYALGHGMRFGAIAVYLLLEFPFRRAADARNPLSVSLWIGFGLLACGYFAITLFPAYRAALLHLTLMGGFAVITLTVATRVAFGHSGNLEGLRGRNRWVIWVLSLALLGMATRISGDFWPHIMMSHYNYGALLWTSGVLLWAWKVLPKVWQVEREPAPGHS